MLIKIFFKCLTIILFNYNIEHKLESINKICFLNTLH